MTRKSEGEGNVPTDRRVGRTRDLLHHALMSLIQTKGYEAITVQDICDKANVGKSTFYAHYTSKDDLKRSGIEHMRMALSKELGAVPAANDTAQAPWLRFSLPLLEHARTHASLYHSRSEGPEEGVGLVVIRQVVSDLLRDELELHPGERASAALPRELAVQYIVGAYMSVLVWWLESGAKLPPQQVDAMFQHLAVNGL